MFTFRRQSVALILCLVCQHLFAADVFIMRALKTMEDCYQSNHRELSVTMVQCMTRTLEKTANPHSYKMYLENTVKNQGIVVFWNPTGLKITCKIDAASKIVLSQCHEQKLPPLTNGQELSITPPN